MNKQEYVAILDQQAPNNMGSEFWMSGQVRKITLEQAKPLLVSGKIAEYYREPKRMVELTEADGTKETITWGEYLKRRRR